MSIRLGAFRWGGGAGDGDLLAQSTIGLLKFGGQTSQQSGTGGGGQLLVVAYLQEINRYKATNGVF